MPLPDIDGKYMTDDSREERLALSVTGNAPFGPHHYTEDDVRFLLIRLENERERFRKTPLAEVLKKLGDG